MSDYSGSRASRITREWHSAPERPRGYSVSDPPGRHTYSNPFNEKQSYDADDPYTYEIPPTRLASFSALPKLRYYGEDADSDADVDIDDDQPRARAYRFRLERASPSPPTSTEDDSSEDEPVVAEPRLDAGGRRARSVMNIVESRYTGLGILGRPHGARVTVVEGPGAEKPLFRWIHFPWMERMDLDDFADEVSRTPGLTATEVHTLTDLLDEVRRKHVRTLPTTGPRPARAMTPSSLRRTIPSDDTLGGRATSTPRTVTWVCVPYFSLEAYSRLDSASGFPAKALLQAQFSRTGKGRDMQQAVCLNGGVPAGHCYHIAQLWCLVLDNSLLFTCCRLPETSLLGDTIQRILRPDTNRKPKRKISVVYRGSVMWSIPLERCQTFFAFISYFREVWPRRLLFYRHSRRITPDYWPKILRTASRTGVTLELKIGRPPAPPPRGVLIKPPEVEAPPDANPTENPSNGPQPEPSKKPPAPTSHFAVLTCLDGVSATDPYDRPVLEKQLEKVDHILLCDTSFRDRKKYRSCPEDSRATLYQFLEAGGATQQEGASEAPARRQKTVDDNIDLFNSVDAVFRFFFPAESAGLPTVGKYWGAVGRVLRESPAPKDLTREPIYRSPQLDFASSMLRSLASKLDSFNEVFKHATKDDRVGISVPDELMEAWMHLLMGLVYFHSDQEVAAELISEASELIDEALKGMVMNMSKYTLQAQAMLLPMELVCLIALELMGRAPPGLPDITTTYADRLAAINNEVVNKPSDRSHERNIDLLKQESRIIQGVLASQVHVFSSLLRDSRDMTGGPRPSAKRDEEWEEEKTRIRSTTRISPGLKGAKLSLTGVEAGGYAELLADECLIHVERMDDEFKQIRYQARCLSDFNQNKVDTTKDRQERAIYVFTIVTIIFLPLGAVSSIFGMNTADIRDMELSQWAYWAAALPVTAAVIFLGLLFTGELRNLLRWAVEGPKRKEAMFEGTEDEWLLGRGELEYVGRSRRKDNPRVHWS